MCFVKSEIELNMEFVVIMLLFKMQVSDFGLNFIVNWAMCYIQRIFVMILLAI